MSEYPQKSTPAADLSGPVKNCCKDAEKRATRQGKMPKMITENNSAKCAACVDGIFGMQTMLRDKLSMKWCEKHQKRGDGCCGWEVEESREFG